MALFKPFRGSRSVLDAQEMHDGYAYFCTDDGSFHIDYVDEDGNLQRKQISAKEAESLTGYNISTMLNSSDEEIPTSNAVFNAIDEVFLQKEISNSIKGFVKGNPIVLTDISPLQHELSVKLIKTESTVGKNIFHFTDDYNKSGEYYEDDDGYYGELQEGAYWSFEALNGTSKFIINNDSGDCMANYHPDSDDAYIQNIAFDLKPLMYSLDQNKKYTISAHMLGEDDWSSSCAIIYFAGEQIFDIDNNECSPFSFIPSQVSDDDKTLYFESIYMLKCTIGIQLEEGEIATEYEDFCASTGTDVPASGLALIVTNENQDTTMYESDTNGVVNGVYSTYPTMTLTADENITIEVQYNKDINIELSDVDNRLVVLENFKINHENEYKAIDAALTDAISRIDNNENEINNKASIDSVYDKTDVDIMISDINTGFESIIKTTEGINTSLENVDAAIEGINESLKDVDAVIKDINVEIKDIKTPHSIVNSLVGSPVVLTDIPQLQQELSVKLVSNVKNGKNLFYFPQDINENLNGFTVITMKGTSIAHATEGDFSDGSILDFPEITIDLNQFGLDTNKTYTFSVRGEYMGDTGFEGYVNGELFETDEENYEYCFKTFQPTGNDILSLYFGTYYYGGDVYFQLEEGETVTGYEDCVAGVNVNGATVQKLGKNYCLISGFDLSEKNGAKLLSSSQKNLEADFNFKAGHTYTISADISGGNPNRQEKAFLIQANTAKTSFIGIGYFPKVGRHSFTFTVGDEDYTGVYLFAGNTLQEAQQYAASYKNLTVCEGKPQEYTADENGVVKGVTSFYPTTTLLTNTDGAIIHVDYINNVNEALGIEPYNNVNGSIIVGANITDVLRYTKQELTAEQKAQIIENLGLTGFINEMIQASISPLEEQIRQLTERLNSKITYGTEEPSGGSDGDVYIQTIN